MRESTRGVPRPVRVPAKVTIPSLPRVLRRPRLLTLLDRGLRCRVAWVMGPPGAGKTTLVASYLKARRRPGVWVRLDEGDADLSAFIHYLSLAVGTVSTPRRPPLPALTPDFASTASIFLRRYFERLSDRLPKRSVIVLDNYHEVSASAALHALLPAALSGLAAHVSLVIVSRLAPPPSFGLLTTRGELSVIPPEALNLNASEHHGLVALYHPGAPPTRRSQYLRHARLARGWMAGATLLLRRQPESTDPDPRRLTGSLRDVFGYLASETLDRASQEQRRFLLETSLLPEFTSAIASHVTGATFAADYLDGLHRTRFFTEQTLKKTPWYRYHPLFRSALAEAAERELPAARARDIRCVGGRTLVEAGLVDAGVELLVAAGEWTGAGDALLEVAPALIQQGRVNTLVRWLDSAPESLSDAKPWLRYWRALCHALSASPQARAAAESATRGFEACGDAVGALAARSLLVLAQFVAGGPLANLDEMLESVPDQPRDLPPMPLELELQVTDLFASALVWRKPGEARTRTWIEYVVSLKRRHVPPADQPVLFPSVEQHYLWCDNLQAAREALDVYKRYVSALRSPLSSLGCAYADSLLLWHTGETDACRRVTAEGVAISQREGLAMWEQAISSQAIYNALFAGDLSTAGALVERTRPIGMPAGGLFALHHEFLEAWTLLLAGDLQRAWETIRPERHRPDIAVGPFASCMTLQLRAYIALARRDYEEAARYCVESEALGTVMHSDYVRHGAAFIRAACAFARGDDAHGNAALEDALGIGRQLTFWGFPGWDPHVIARLSSRALAAGIEPTYTRELIRRRCLPRPAEAVLPHEWPWAVEIRAFGGFNVRAGGAPLAQSRKSPHRLLEVLRVIVALGGTSVPVNRVSDLFWPDVDGDAARENLDKTLQRLRRLLGHPHVLPVRDGRVSINPELVWVDALAFETLVAHRDAMSRAKALDLYTGPLFGSLQLSSLEQAQRDRFVRVRGTVAQDEPGSGQSR